MPIHEISQLHIFIGFHFYRLSFRTVLQIAVRLAPQIFVDVIRQGDAANRPEPTHGVADRQNR